MRQRLLCCGVFLASGAAHASPTVEVRGRCPNVEIHVEGATPSSRVGVYIGSAEESASTLAHGACAGTVFDLWAVNWPANHIITLEVGSFGTGTVWWPPSLGYFGCRKFVQVIDIATCELSEAVPLRNPLR